jgi:DhnA family fructose-bisphosphate aldolase class Ia
MSGIDLRLQKLLKGKEHLVISALDHVMEYGDQPGIEDATKAIGSWASGFVWSFWMASGSCA